MQIDKKSQANPVFRDWGYEEESAKDTEEEQPESEEEKLGVWDP